MKDRIYNLNRPVHLARRDAFLEKAVATFRLCQAERTHRKQILTIDEALYYLNSAVDHSALAANASTPSPMEPPFLLFLRTLLFTLYSVRIIIDNEHALQDRKSPLWQFLHRNGKADAEVKFARGSEQLLEDVAHLIGMIEAPFRDIQKAAAESFSEQDRARYRRAYEGLQRHLADSRGRRGFTRGQTFWPTLEMKYG